MYRILTLNFGGTSAKLSVWEDEICAEDYSMDYTQEEIDLSLTSEQEVELKTKKVLEWLNSIHMEVADFDAIAPRFGGIDVYKRQVYDTGGIWRESSGISCTCSCN